MKISISILFVILFTCTLFAQSDSSVFVVPEMNIYQMEKGKEVLYEFEHKNNLIILIKDTLTVSPQYYNYSSGLESVNKISFKNGSHFWNGALVGAGFGYLLGFFGYGIICDLFDWERGPVSIGPFITAFIPSIPLGLIGGLIGLTSPKYDEYDLNPMSVNQKQIYLSKVLRKIQHNKKK